MIKIIMRFALVSLIACLFTGCQTYFDGSRTGNSSEFIIEYSVLNKSDSQTLDLQEGDILNIDVVSDSGKVDIKVTQNDGKVLYSERNVLTGLVELTIPESGEYKCTVTGKSASGSVSFTISDIE